MICCDSCEAWQHNECMGVTENEDEQPESYHCEQCRPEEHPALLAATRRGEKPWEDRKQARLERERQERNEKKRGKGGRKSVGGRKSQSTQSKAESLPELDTLSAAEEPQPVVHEKQESGMKRKHEAAESMNGEQVCDRSSGQSRNQITDLSGLSVKAT